VQRQSGAVGIAGRQFPIRHAASGPPLPVIVWLHPGSFVAASAGIAPQNGTRFVEEADAVVVAPNYRLGPFGFLVHGPRGRGPSHPVSGNYGLSTRALARCGTTSPVRR
jgi:para-nitrobenzyl esterase